MIWTICIPANQSCDPPMLSSPHQTASANQRCSSQTSGLCLWWWTIGCVIRQLAMNNYKHCPGLQWQHKCLMVIDHLVGFGTNLIRRYVCRLTDLAMIDMGLWWWLWYPMLNTVNSSKSENGLLNRKCLKVIMNIYICAEINALV